MRRLALGLVFALACGPPEASTAGAASTDGGGAASSVPTASPPPSSAAPSASASAGVASSASQAVTVERDPQGRLLVSAEPATPYADVVHALDAALRLSPGSQVAFTPPRGASAGHAPRGTSLAAPKPLPLGFKKPAQFVLVTLSKTKLTVDDVPTPVVSYPAGSLGGEGLPLTAKPEGAQSLFIEPLAKALEVGRGKQAQVKPSSDGIGLVIAADQATPYRALFEVLFTASQGGFERFDLLVRGP